jgi:hypothetical protein
MGFGAYSGAVLAKLLPAGIVLSTMLRILRTLFVGTVVGLILLPLGLLAAVIGLPLLLIAGLIGAPLLVAAALVLGVLVFAAGLVVAVIAGKLLLFVVFPIWLIVEITRSCRRPRIYTSY